MSNEVACAPSPDHLLRFTVEEKIFNSTAGLASVRLFGTGTGAEENIWAEVVAAWKIANAQQYPYSCLRLATEISPGFYEIWRGLGVLAISFT